MTPLPSSDSARDLIEGKPGALGRLAFHLAGRAGLMAIGMALLTDLPPHKILRASAAGALSIEAFCLLWFATQQAPQ